MHIRLIVAALVFAPSFAAAQTEKSPVWAFIADTASTANPTTPTREILLRPNSQDSFNCGVVNSTQGDQSVSVIVKAGETTIAASGPINAKAGETTFVKFASAANATPTTIPAVGGGFPLTLVVNDASGKAIDSSVVPLRIRNPSRYVSAACEFSGGNPNELSVRIDGKTFSGKPAAAKLLVSPDRIPGLLSDEITATLNGEVSPSQSLKLFAKNLRFSGPAPRNAIIAVSVDGWERAFSWAADLSVQGEAKKQPTALDRPSIRIAAPSTSRSGSDFVVKLEADNAPDEGCKLMLQFGLPGETNPAQVRTFNSDRETAMAVKVDGQLQITTSVRDYEFKLETAGLTGKRQLTATMSYDVNGRPVTETARKDVIFDGTEPSKVAFVGLKKKQLAGGQINVAATAVDPESDIAKVEFFLTKPPAPDKDGKLPMGSPEPVVGKKNEGRFMATLTPAAEKKGVIAVFVRATNGVGLFKDAEDSVELVDAAAAAAAAKFGTVRGTLLLGDTKQPNKTVKLIDSSGQARTVQTTAEGVFEFKDVAPGNYHVYAERPETKVKGDATVTVAAGETAEPVLKLSRR